MSCRRGRADLVGGLRVLPGGQHRCRQRDHPLGTARGGRRRRGLRGAGHGRDRRGPGCGALAVGVLLAGAAAGWPSRRTPTSSIARSHAQRRDVVWSTISSGTGWGVALAGPVAIVAGDHWRAAWVVFVVLAVAVGALSVLLAPAHDVRAAAPPTAEPQLVLLPEVPSTAACRPSWWVAAARSGGRSASTRCGAPGSTPPRPGSSTRSAGRRCCLASFSGVVFERRGLRPSYLGSTALLAASLGLLAVATANLAAVLVAAVLFGAFYATVIAAHGIWSAGCSLAILPPASPPSAPHSPSARSPGPCWPGSRSSTAATPRRLIGAAVVTLAAHAVLPAVSERREILAAHEQECTAARSGRSTRARTNLVVQSSQEATG